MQTFDPLTLLEHVWDDASTEITILLLIIFGGLMVWVTFRKLVQS